MLEPIYFMSSQGFRPKFITFLQLSFDDNWRPVGDSILSDDQRLVMQNMTKLWCGRVHSNVTILDMSYHEVRLKFASSSVVGVANGVFYCNANDVTDTKILDAPAEYSKPSYDGSEKDA